MKKKSEIADSDIEGRREAAKKRALAELEKGEVQKEPTSSPAIEGELRINDNLDRRSPVPPLTPQQKELFLSLTPDNGLTTNQNNSAIFVPPTPVLPKETAEFLRGYEAAKRDLLEIFAAQGDPNRMLAEAFLFANNEAGVDVWGKTYNISLVVQQRLINTLRGVGIVLSSYGSILRRPPRATKPATMDQIRGDS